MDQSFQHAEREHAPHTIGDRDGIEDACRMIGERDDTEDALQMIDERVEIDDRYIFS